MPSYQIDAVNSNLAQLGSQYAGLYNTFGRGFPDISAAGVDYVVAFAGDSVLVAGTSCSAPLFASIINLIDDELAGCGQPPLGFLNPLIYSTPQAFTDILLASNPGCGTQGFSASTGWDPVTKRGLAHLFRSQDGCWIVGCRNTIACPGFLVIVYHEIRLQFESLRNNYLSLDSFIVTIPRPESHAQWRSIDEPGIKKIGQKIE